MLGGVAAAVGGRSMTARAAGLDVVVVGAGAAGLSAATRLRALDRIVLVLEARDRVGGRVVTDRRLGQPFDAGAQYLHWAERNPWTGIAKALGVATISDDDTSPRPFSFFRSGARMPDDVRRERRQAFSTLDDLLTAGALPDRSIADAVRGGGPIVQDGAASTTLLSLGEEPDRVSTADYGELWSGDDLVVPDGFGTLLERYAAGLPVRLGQPVTRIDWGGPDVSVETASGAVRARAAIVTVPIGVLQAGSIAFLPEMPVETRDALEGLQMGAYTKVALRFDRGKLAGDLDSAMDVRSDGATMAVETWPFDRDLVVCTFGGDHARRLCHAGEREAVDHASERLAVMFGDHVRQAIVGGALANWVDDPFARGSYSIAKPGRLPARLAIRRPIGDRIWLAGEASAGGGAMTAGGAALEGERAADEVSLALGT